MPARSADPAAAAAAATRRSRPALVGPPRPGSAPTRWRCRASWRCSLRVPLPLASHRQRQAAVGFAVEDLIAEPLEASHVVLGPELGPGEYLVVVVRARARWRSGRRARGRRAAAGARRARAAGAGRRRLLGARGRRPGAGAARRRDRLRHARRAPSRRFWRADGAPQIVLFGGRLPERVPVGATGPDARRRRPRRRRASTCCRARYARAGRRPAAGADAARRGDRRWRWWRMARCSAPRRCALRRIAEAREAALRARAVGARCPDLPAVAAAGRGPAAGRCRRRRRPRGGFLPLLGAGGGRCSSAAGEAYRCATSATAPRTAGFRCRSRRPTSPTLQRVEDGLARRGPGGLRRASRPPATARPRCATSIGGSRRMSGERADLARAARAAGGASAVAARAAAARRSRRRLAAYLLLVGAAQPLLAARGEALAAIARHEAALARLAALPDGRRRAASPRRREPVTAIVTETAPGLRPDDPPDRGRGRRRAAGDRGRGVRRELLALDRGARARRTACGSSRSRWSGGRSPGVVGARLTLGEVTRCRKPRHRRPIPRCPTASRGATACILQRGGEAAGLLLPGGRVGGGDGRGAAAGRAGRCGFETLDAAALRRGAGAGLPRHRLRRLRGGRGRRRPRGARRQRRAGRRPARPERRRAGGAADQRAAARGDQGERLGHPHRDPGAPPGRALPRRRHPARGARAAAGAGAAAGQPHQGDGASSTSPRSGCRRTAASRCASAATRSTCASRPSRRSTASAW